MEKRKGLLMQEMFKQRLDVPKVQPEIYFVIFMMMILVQISIDQYVPSLPAITKYFHSSESSIQYTLFLFLFGLGSSHLFLGPYLIKLVVDFLLFME